jgi:transcriptional regulator with XRE-family HTH domain
VGTSPSSPDPTDGHAWSQLKGPTALRIVLGTQLRRLREARGITAAAAAQAIHASHAKISRMELGRVSLREPDVTRLLTLYGITDDQDRRALLTLVRQSNVPSWWHQYSDIVPNWFETYLGLEQSSAVIRTYQPQLIPDLLQTPQVARTMIQLAQPRQSDDDIERRLALWMTRQEVLTQPGAPQLWAVIEEAALWRVHGHSLMRRVPAKSKMSVVSCGDGVRHAENRGMHSGHGPRSDHEGSLRHLIIPRDHARLSIIADPPCPGSPGRCR